MPTRRKPTTRSGRRTRPTPEAAGPRPVDHDRRTRPHLRELCDEVLASFRVATDRDVLTDDDRRAARETLARVAPRVNG